MFGKPKTTPSLTEQIVAAASKDAAVKLEAMNKGDGMTIAELSAFCDACARAGVPANAVLRTQVNIKAGIKSLWTA